MSEYELINDGEAVQWESEGFRVVVPLEPVFTRGGRDHYRFSFIIDGKTLVSHEAEKNKHFYFSPGMTIFGMDPLWMLLEAAASFMTVSREDGVDDEFFEPYNADQLAFVGSAMQENYQSAYYDSFQEWS